MGSEIDQEQAIQFVVSVIEAFRFVNGRTPTMLELTEQIVIANRQAMLN